MVFLGIQAIVPIPTSELFFEHVCMILLRYSLWAPSRKNDPNVSESTFVTWRRWVFHRWTRSSLWQFGRTTRVPLKPAVHFITSNFWKNFMKIARGRRPWTGCRFFIRTSDIVQDGSKLKLKRLYSSRWKGQRKKGFKMERILSKVFDEYQFYASTWQV